MSQGLLLLLVGVVCVAEQARAFDLTSKNVKDAIDLAWKSYQKLENGDITTSDVDSLKLKFTLHDGYRILV